MAIGKKCAGRIFSGSVDVSLQEHSKCKRKTCAAMAASQTSVSATPLSFRVKAIQCPLAYCQPARPMTWPETSLP